MERPGLHQQGLEGIWLLERPAELSRAGRWASEGTAWLVELHLAGSCELSKVRSGKLHDAWQLHGKQPRPHSICCCMR